MQIDNRQPVKWVCPSLGDENMKIVILGAGVVGVTTAWYLSQNGHDVTVIDRDDAAAMDTSFANAGQISPGYASPWAAPGIPTKALKWMFKEHSPLLFRPDGSLYQIKWMFKMLAECSADRYSLNKERMLRVAEYSRDMFRQLRADTGIQYQGRQLGTLQLFRKDEEVLAAKKDIRVLQELGIEHQVLTPEQCLEYEPALKSQLHLIKGGLRLPNDETGDCHLFTQTLAKMCEDNGVKFWFNRNVDRIEHDNKRVTAVYSNGQQITADHFVCCLGTYSHKLMQTIGIDLPIYPIKGYSLTIPITNPDAAPVSTILDETYKVAITRFDDRIRVGGMAELSGYKIHLNPKRRETLELVVNDLYPNGGDVSKATFWSGLRPVTPDSTPIMGGSRFENMSINAGHGTLGWTMSLGSARVMADLISGKQPDIRTDDLSMQRYAKGSETLVVPMR